MPNADYRDCLELAGAIAESINKYDSDDDLEPIIPHLQPVIGELLELRALVSAAEDYFYDHESAPQGWFRRLFLLQGDHMILTSEGWEPGEAKQSYVDSGDVDEILDEINPPVPVATLNN